MIYGLLVFILAFFTGSLLAFIAALPILLIVSIFDAMRLEKHKESINIGNMISLSIIIFIIGYLFRIVFIWRFDQPLEKVLIYYLSIITIIAYYKLSSREILFRRILIDLLAGLVILVIMIFSTFGSYYILFYLYGSIILFDWIRFAIILPAMITVGFGEEALFRGLLQNIFRDRFGVRKGVFIASFIFFALWHTAWIFDYGLTINFLYYVLFTGILGVLLGLAYEGSESLLPVIIAHALWDSYQGALFIGNVTFNPIAYFIAFIISIVIYVLALFYIRRIISSLYRKLA